MAGPPRQNPRPEPEPELLELGTESRTASDYHVMLPSVSVSTPVLKNSNVSRRRPPNSTLSQSATIASAADRRPRRVQRGATLDASQPVTVARRRRGR